jgi:hypothetical protein
MLQQSPDALTFNTIVTKVKYSSLGDYVKMKGVRSFFDPAAHTLA